MEKDSWVFKVSLQRSAVVEEKIESQKMYSLEKS